MPILPDLLAPDLSVVFCGTAAGTQSALVGAYYAGPGNRFWQTLHEIGLTPTRLAPADAPRLIDMGIGLTDIAKHASGPDHRIGRNAYDAAGLRDKIQRYRPRYLAFNGRNAARAFLGRRPVPGRQSELIGETRLFVLPSTSGAARKYWDIAVWRELAGAIRAGY